MESCEVVRGFLPGSALVVTSPQQKGSNQMNYVGYWSYGAAPVPTID
mgnify:CR=1 FL=1